MKAPFLSVLALLAAGCSSGADMAESLGVDTQASMTERATASARKDDGADTVFEDTAESDGNTRAFSYSWPALIAREPALVERLAGERDALLARQKAEWNEALELAAQGGDEGASWHNREESVNWKVVADTPRFLSLSVEVFSYTGGVHGNYGSRALMWDRRTNQGFDPLTMFSSPAALSAAIGQRLCAELDVERAKRRAESRSGEKESIFTDCPAMTSTVIFPGSAHGQLFDRLSFYYGPSTAGPYSEGIYQIDLPVTEAVVSAVKPDYRPAFSAAGSPR